MGNINWFFISSLSLTITELFLIVILLKYGKERIHKIWILFNLSVFLWGLGSLIISLSFNNFYLSSWAWKLADIPVSFIAVFLLHMTLELTKKRQNILLVLSYAQAFLFFFISISTNLMAKLSLVKYKNLFYLPKPGELYLAWFIIWILIITYAHFCIIQYSLVKKREEKYNLKLLIYGIAFGCICGSLNFINFANPTLFQFANFGIVIYCLVVTYAIFKHQILGIEIVYKKGLLYSILIAVLSGLYLLLIYTAEFIFRGILGYKSSFISIASAFIIAILFNPIRDIVQAFIDKIFIGKTPQEIAKENKLLKQELERSERLKTASTLALGLAHEIRNPLTTIRTFAEFLPEKYKDEEFVNKFSKLIPSEVERINSIIKQLLNYSKPTPPSFCERNVHQLIKEILEFLNSQFLRKRIQVNLHDGNIAQLIRIDPNQIKQALLNIFLNAIDAMPNGGILDIGVSIEEYLKIRITDTGYGIPEEDIKRIFDPFFSSKDTGTGLGLAITSQIIKNNNGFIEVESTVGKGTTFIVKLPLRN